MRVGSLRRAERASLLLGLLLVGAALADQLAHEGQPVVAPLVGPGALVALAAAGIALLGVAWWVHARRERG